MKKITEHTYEAYLLDYLEGTLDVSLVAEMESFLARHPGLLEEARESMELRIVPTGEAYPGMDGLYRSDALPSELEYGPLFAAAADGTLNAEELREVDTLLKDYPALGREFRAYQLTRLPVEESLAYPFPDSLKKAVPLIPVSFTPWLRVAAATALLAVSVWGILRIQTSTIDVPAGMARMEAAESVDPVIPSPTQDIPEQSVPFNDRITTSGIAQPAATEAKPANVTSYMVSGEPSQENTRQPMLASMESLEMDPGSLRYQVITDRPPYALYPSRKLSSLMWLTSDPLLAEIPEEEVVFRSHLLGRFAGIGGRKTNPSLKEKQGPGDNFWRLADASVAAINLLTDNALALNRDLDEDGRVVGYALSSERFTVERKRRID